MSGDRTGRDALVKSEGRRKRAVLVYDGSCPVCKRMVAWIKANERKDAFEMLSCQSDEVRTRFPFIEKAVCMRAMQLILPDGRILAGEKALPEILKRTKRYGPMAEIFRLPGSETLSRAFYRWFADRRYHISEVFFPGKRRKKN